MLGNQAVKQYFATNRSHYILPAVSIEWNYNLFYYPYATANGDGSLFTPTNSFTDVSSWSTHPVKVPKGTVTSVFKSDVSLTTRSCLSFPSSNGHGSSMMHVNTPSSTKTYKIVFHAKVDSDVEVDLTALSFVDSHRSHSSSQLINSIVWTKFEVYVSSRPVDTQYSGFNFTLDYTARDTSATYSILIDRMQMYETTDFEYQYGNLWPTSSPFSFFRPGESYVPSGNALTPLPADFRKVNTKLLDSWNNQKYPCSPVTFHPKLISNNSKNPLFKNGILSEYTQYKYFVGEGTSSSIAAIYDQKLYTNKIVLKFNLRYSTPSALTVTIINDQDINGVVTQNSSQVISLTNADIHESGTCVLYRQTDGTWKSDKQGGSWQVMPQFDNDGNITNSTPINKIVVNQSAAIINSNNPTSIKDLNGTAVNIENEMKKLQVIEISPRLEVDVSRFTMTVETTSELDNKQNPLPISAISSNSARVDLSNIPLKISNEVLSLFSNNSSTSPLKGLFKKNVKFYINYVIKDSVGGLGQSQSVVAGGVYYADTWDARDLERTTVNLFDVTKYLQMLPPTDYVSQSEDPFLIISNLLDFAGFTDYDYDQLKFITKSSVKKADGTVVSNSAPIKMEYFYADGAQQKVFDVLREIFEVYQIGAYIDPYGVMKFLSIDNIFDGKKPSMILHDSKTPILMTPDKYSDSLTVTSNIVQDTYTESVKTKIGKAVLRYKTPQVSRSIAADDRLLNPDLYVNYDAAFIQSSNVIWDITLENEVATYNTLGKSILTESQNYFYIKENEINQSATNNFKTFGVNHDGFAIIEGEIVSFKDKELAFSITSTDQSGGKVVTDVAKTRIVANESELKSARTEIIAEQGIAGSVSSRLTGKIVNVQRGLFNTPVKKHVVMSSVADVLEKFDAKSGSSPVWDTSNKAIALPATTGGSILVAKNEVSHSYNTFSAKMLIGPNAGNDLIDGLQGGLVLYSGAGAESVRVYIKQIARVKSSTNDGYQLFVTDSAGTSMFIDGIESYDIDSIILGDAKKYPVGSPFEELSKSINLKFVKLTDSDNAFDVYINNNKVGVQTKKNLNINTDGQFGIFSRSSIGTQSVLFKELYATQTPLNVPGLNYHYELPSFVEKIASNKKIFEINHMIQTEPAIVGINYYDIKDSLAPSMNAYPLKVKYDWYYLKDGEINPVTKVKKSPEVMTVDEESLSYSPVYHSGFRSKFAIVNSSPSQVWIKKTTPDGNNQATVDFSLVTNSLITQGDEVVIEKIFDPSNILETVDIASNWVQSRNTAMAILKNVYRCLDGFSRDTTISVYGNPLYEIGDVVHIQYNLKNIGFGETIENRYFVQGVQQTFSTGLQTVLTLNQIA